MIPNTRYKVYMNVGDGYFQVYPLNSIILPKKRFGEEIFQRFAWNDLTFSNDPQKYTATGLDGYRVYDLINEADFTQELNVKLEWTNSSAVDREVIGKFARKDCEFEDDNIRKIVIVKPTILDQYTDVLGNWETEVNISRGGNGNKIINGDFESWVNDTIPESWLRSNTGFTNRYVGTDFISVLLNHDPAFVGYIYQLISVEKGDILNIDFDYFGLSPFSTPLMNMQLGVILNGTYWMAADGTWSTSAVPYFYAENVVPELFPTAATFTNYTKESVQIPEEGTIELRWYVPDENDLLLDNISVDSYLTTRKTISIPVGSEYIETYVGNPTSELTPFGWTIPNASIIGIKDSDFPDLTEYFESSGEPKESLFSSATFGPADQEGSTLTALQTALAEQYFEDSSVTVYRGHFYKKWLTGYRRLRGTAEFSRDETYKTDERDGGGDLIPPVVGVGWKSAGEDFTNTVGDTFDSSGRRLWVRLPYNGAYDTWTLGSIDTGNTPETGEENDNGYFRWQERLTSTRNYPIPEESQTFDTGMDFKDMIKSLYRNTHESLTDKEVISTFFWNDNYADFPITINATQNYVTMADNWLNELSAIHTFSIQTNPAQNSTDSELNVTLKKFLEDLAALFVDCSGERRVLYWFIDDDLNLHIEHLKYFEVTESSIDLRDSATNAVLLKETNSYKYDDSKMFGQITYNMMNAGYLDFTNNVIKFPSIISNSKGQDLNSEGTTEIITSDIKYCLENPNDLDNGLILLDTTNYVVNSRLTQLAKKSFLNGALSYSSLINDFGKHRGVWIEGTLNAADINCVNTIRNKVGKQLNVKGIFESLFFTTGIGIGISDLELDFSNEKTLIDLRYKYDSNPDNDGFWLMIQKETDFAGAGQILFDFGNF